MRRIRKQWLWAVGTSLVCHALLIAVVFLVLPDAQASRTAEAGLDNRLHSTATYEAISLSFDESPSAGPLKQQPMEPPANVEVPIAKADDQPGKSALTPPAGELTSKQLTAVAKAAAGAGSGSQPIRSLHYPIGAGRSVVYVLDHSGSMGRGNRLVYAVASIKASLRELDPAARFQIVTYDSRAMIFRLAGKLDLATATSANIADAERLLDELVAEGSSRHVDGMRLGLGLSPSLLILLTDAGELSSADVSSLKRFNHKGTDIHAVLIDSDDRANVATLHDLAKGVHFIHTQAPNP